MKKILFSLALCALALGFSSCNDDNDEFTDSHVETLPVITVQGDKFVEHMVGTAYNDAGATVKFGDEDYTQYLEVNGLDELDVDFPGLYKIEYYCANQEWPQAYDVKSRTVAVCNPAITTDFSGTYNTVAGTKRLRYTDAGVIETPYAGFPVTIEKVVPGMFEVSCILGQYYELYVGYAESNDYLYDFTMTGYMILNEDNTVDLLSGDVPAWGDSFDDFFDGVYDPEAGTLSWTVVYAGMDFHVELKID